MIIRITILLFIIVSFGCSTNDSFKEQKNNTHTSVDNNSSMVNYNIPNTAYEKTPKIEDIILNKKAEISNRHIDKYKTNSSLMNENKSNRVVTVLMIIVVYSFIFIWISGKVRNKNKN